MAQQIQLRNDSAAAWEAENPILAQAEVGVNTTTGQFKIGDGTSTWEELEYYAGGSANVADFVFLDDGGDGSYMTVTDHDMTIQTVRDEDSVGSDCDINIEAADDVFIRAYGDEIDINAASDVTISSNTYRGDGTDSQPLYGSQQEWVFDKNGRITFPDGSMQISAGQGLDPLEDFLTWEEQRGHLQYLNTHFGWDSDGVWFTGAAEGGSSYPIFTNFTIPQNVGVTVSFDVNINSECSDMGVAIYNAATTPVWDDNPNTTRIAAQFDCFDLKIYGRTTQVAAGDGEGVPSEGIYTVTFTYNPTASTDKVTVSYKVEGSDETIATISLNEALPSGPYRVGFAADQNNPNVRTYMTNLSIVTSDNEIDHYDSLDDGDSTIIGGGSANLVVPTAIKDDNGDDFITFTRTSTGTARIETPQDDLSLRSARDITLFAGDEGPGNVYIGWGDANLTPDATNRVATIGDIQSLTTGNFEFNNSTMFTEGSMSIQGLREDSALGADVELDPNDGRVSLYGYTGGNTTSYSTSDWTGNATWSSYGEGGSQVVLAGATALVTFLNETFNQAPVRSVSINGSEYYAYDGMSGNSENVTIYTITGAPESSTTVTSLEFRYQVRSVIEINDDDEEILIEGKGLDVKLKSTEDISFTSNLDEDSEYTWAMGSNGKFRLPGDGYIENVVNGSGDESGNDTIKIVPDSNREDTDQYLIIDPTFGSPSHIHIRAGGQQDNSNADLILGGERTNVRVSDTDGTVYISSKRPDTTDTYENVNGDEGPIFVINADLSNISPNANFSVEVGGTLYVIDSVQVLDIEGSPVTEITATPATFVTGESYTIHESNYENYWAFEENGYLNGPAMGGLYVTGIMNPNGDLYLGSDQSIILSSGDGGEFIGDSSSADNQIATIGDINTAVSPVDTVFTVEGGTLGTQPTFDGAPLFTGSYVKAGVMVHFRIDVDFDNITSFGTGQYYLNLPFTPKYNYMFTGGCLHDASTGRTYAINGHVFAGNPEMRLESTDNTGNVTFNIPFTATAPIALAVEDSFHIYGDYIVDTEG
jgi:hypothetical protein